MAASSGARLPSKWCDVAVRVLHLPHELRRLRDAPRRRRSSRPSASRTSRSVPPSTSAVLAGSTLPKRQTIERREARRPSVDLEPAAREGVVDVGEPDVPAAEEGVGAGLGRGVGGEGGGEDEAQSKHLWLLVPREEGRGGMTLSTGPQAVNLCFRSPVRSPSSRTPVRTPVRSETLSQALTLPSSSAQRA